MRIHMMLEVVGDDHDAVSELHLQKCMILSCGCDICKSAAFALGHQGKLCIWTSRIVRAGNDQDLIVQVRKTDLGFFAEMMARRDGQQGRLCGNKHRINIFPLCFGKIAGGQHDISTVDQLNRRALYGWHDFHADIFILILKIAQEL